MKIQIGVLTATRAEFGLLKPLILRLMEEDFCEVKVLVTGTHLCPEFGNTYKEIEEAKIPIAEKIKCVTKGDVPGDISNNMAMALNGFGEYFETHKLDLLIVLGDRYETMAVCMAAMNAEIPIAHIHGGESTEGLIDEAIRHSITKMSQVHFVSTEMYRHRVIQMGEQPERVFNVGALAVENTKNNDFMTREELEKDLNFKFKNTLAVATFHPVTLDVNSGIDQFEELLSAIEEFDDMSFIFTKANADSGGRKINNKIDDFAEKHNNIIAVASLGVRRYLSVVRESAVVIGNSSSGITEAPCLHTPTVNIGDRQRGRLMPDSVLCCKPDKEDIVRTIRKAVSEEFQKSSREMTNPFGTGKTSEMITAILKNIFAKEGSISIVKDFYDLKD